MASVYGNASSAHNHQFPHIRIFLLAHNLPDKRHVLLRGHEIGDVSQLQNI